MKIGVTVIIAILAAGAAGFGISWIAHDNSATVSRLNRSDRELKRELDQARRREYEIQAQFRTASARLARAKADEIEPPCPSPHYGADGTAGPLFCQAADPVILAYYRKAYPQMFALGPDSTPQQVLAVVQNHPSTLPIECDAYTLAHALNQWQFAFEPVPGCTV